MRQKTSHLLIGTFVIVGTLLLVFGVMAVSSGSGLKRTLEVETYFVESVQGLEVGSPLRFRGVRIGEVRQISFVNEFYATDQTYALVRVAVSLKPLNTDDPEVARKKIAEFVARGLRVRLASQGITGALYLESDISDKPKSADLPIDWTPLVLHVPSAPSVLERFSASLDSLLARIGKLDLEGLVAEARRSLGNVARSADADAAGSLAAELRDTLRVSRDAVVKLEGKASPLLDALRNTVSATDRAVAALEQRFAGKESEEAFANLNQVLADARPAVQQLSGALEIAKKTLLSLDRSVGAESRDLAAMVANLRQISEHLRGLTESLEQHPARLLFGDPPKPVLKDR